MGEEAFFQGSLQDRFKDLDEESINETGNFPADTYDNLYSITVNDPINFYDLLGLLINRQTAEALLVAYNVVDYKTMSKPKLVYDHIGGWLNEKNDAGDAQFTESCALRLSIAFSASGVNLDGEAGANNIGANGNSANIGGHKHVIISARQMAAFLRKKFGAPDYPSKDEYDQSGCVDGDILIWGDDLHVGMAPSADIAVGNFRTGPIWVSRAQ